MCGIVGYISSEKRGAAFKNALTVLEHRGPDDGSGYSTSIWNSYCCEIGARRLAIRDTSPLGKQPMERNGCAIVFNGEIYNSEKIRGGLSRNGYKFYSRSDTEVVLNAYDFWGAEFVKQLEGIFALGIVDKKRELIVLSRDRFGAKPLYLFKNNDAIIFASEIKAILAFGIPPKPNIKALQKHVLLNWFMGGDETETFFQNIFSVAPGTTRVFTDFGQGLETKYYSPRIERARLSLAESEALGERLVRESITSELVGEYPVAVPLSGGVDSSTIAAVASGRLGRQAIHLFTFSYENNGGEEDLSAAKAFADYLRESGVNAHHVAVPLNDCITETTFEKATWARETPIFSPHFLSFYNFWRYIKKSGFRVAMSGTGSDEIFHGYHASPGFSGLYQNSGRLTAEDILNNFFLKEKAPLLKSDFMEDGIRSVIDRLGILTRPPQTLDDAQKLSLIFIKTGLLEELKNADAFGMAHGVEVRVPFLNSDLVDFALSLPLEYHLGGSPHGRHILRKLLLSNGAPRSIAFRQKYPTPSPKKYLTDLLRIFEKNLKEMRSSALLREVYQNSFIDNLELYLGRLKALSLSGNNYSGEQKILTELLGIFFFDRVFINRGGI